MTTKQKILKSALKLFATQGIDKTSTAQITTAVGISSGALFVHFKTKKALIYALHQQVKEASMHDLAALCEPQNSVEQNLKAITKKLIEYYLAHYHEFIFIELVENDPEFATKALSETAEVYDGLLHLIATWIEAGDLKPLELDFLLRVIWSLMAVIIRNNKAQNKTTVDEACLEIIWAAVKA